MGSEFPSCTSGGMLLPFKLCHNIQNGDRTSVSLDMRTKNAIKQSVKSH